ncbi:OmpA family protein [Actibacterium sp. 188UL27-1]|uniref:OmpA family protein n=1 Tax=Actibacterium sp. 188UL27-1 TaxID=2786961 RepID=UPI00195EDDD9|nr:OmpA family protein [Actibacterium sp. 188UL27-1]MBM7067426.1 OmpA family protein [Actibacterium sp. 188UL27-1]
MKVPYLTFAAFPMALAVTLATATAQGNDANPITDSSALSAEELQERFLKQSTRGITIIGEDGESQTGAIENVKPVSNDYVELPINEQVFVSVSFDFNSDELRDDQKPKLTTLCQAMTNVAVEQFRVVGHTDASGGAEYNMELSMRRAEAVRGYLISSCGLDASRLLAIGKGEEIPVNQADPRAVENRRVEFQAVQTN